MAGRCRVRQAPSIAGPAAGRLSRPRRGEGAPDGRVDGSEGRVEGAGDDVPVVVVVGAVTGMVPALIGVSCGWRCGRTTFTRGGASPASTRGARPAHWRGAGGGGGPLGRPPCGPGRAARQQPVVV